MPDETYTRPLHVDRDHLSPRGYRLRVEVGHSTYQAITLTPQEMLAWAETLQEAGIEAGGDRE